MNSIYTKELLIKLSEILHESIFDADPEGNNDDNIKYIQVDGGDWVENGKYSYCDITFFFPDLNVYVHTSQSRSGSYYGDFYYDDPTFSFVEPRTKTVVITEYVGINL